MAYPGLKKPQDRANLIAYLRTQMESPAPLPSVEEIAAETPKEEVSDVEKSENDKTADDKAMKKDNAKK